MIFHAKVGKGGINYNECLVTVKVKAENEALFYSKVIVSFCAITYRRKTHYLVLKPPAKELHPEMSI